MAQALEVADIFRRHGEAFRQARAGRLGRIERRVMGAITACRTAVLGGHVEQCDDCGATRIAYNSCRNRHCPKCQGTATARWLEARRPSCCRCRTFMSSSRCRRARPARVPEHRASFTRCCSARRPRPCSWSRPIRNTSAPSIGCLPFSTPGARLCSTTRMSTASCRVVGLHRTAHAGSLAAPVSSCRCASSRGCSAAVLAGAEERLRGRQTAVLHQSRQSAEPQAFARRLPNSNASTG